MTPSHTSAPSATIQGWPLGDTRVTKTQHPDHLVCVRYRESVQGQRVVTIEIVVDERAPKPSVDIGVRIDYRETREREQAKQAGARWDPATKLWRMPRREALRLGWRHRIQPG